MRLAAGHEQAAGHTVSSLAADELLRGLWQHEQSHARADALPAPAERLRDTVFGEAAREHRLHVVEFCAASPPAQLATDHWRPLLTS